MKLKPKLRMLFVIGGVSLGLTSIWTLSYLNSKLPSWTEFPIITTGMAMILISAATIIAGCIGELPD